MPERKTRKRARRARQQGKAPSTQAGEFVREEMEHVRKGKHGARSAKQVIAIGLSKARRAGVKLKPRGRGATAGTRRRAAHDLGKGQSRRPTSGSRARASRRTLKRAGRGSASRAAPSRQARTGVRRRRTRAPRS
jgi:hypothetical protein